MGEAPRGSGVWARKCGTLPRQGVMCIGRLAIPRAGQAPSGRAAEPSRRVLAGRQLSPRRRQARETPPRLHTDVSPWHPHVPVTARLERRPTTNVLLRRRHTLG